MNRMYRRAGVALLLLGIAGFATFVWAQQGSTPLPPPSGPAVTLPPPSTSGSPALPVPGVTLPAPGDSAPPAATPPKGPAVTIPSPGSTLPTPGSTLPTPGPKLPAAPPVTIPGSPEPPMAGPPAPTLPGSPMGVTIPMTSEPEKASNDDHGPGAADNLSGRQEPAVSLEWIGPPAAKVGLPADYTIAVRNVCNIAVQQVLVRVRLPQGVQVMATEPKAVTEENILMWEIGTLLPKQERNLQVKLMSAQKGDINCQAWVTFTGSSAMRIRVREPKLLIKTTAPEKVLVGDPCTFVVTVSNPGDHPADQVKVHCDLSEGLEHVKGNKVDYDLGTLAAGETRSVQVICGTKVGGEQKCEAYAEAEGGLKATDKTIANVIMPRIDLEVVGPKLKYLDRKAVYTFKVTNPGDAPAYNVSVSDVIPPGFKFLQADNGGRHDFTTRSVSWFLGELGPGQSREVKAECLATSIGEWEHKITANASRGLKVEDKVMTRVKGLSAILLEMVDLDDPIEVGAETQYEIRITNTGSETETDVKLMCIVPDKMQFKSATGPARYTQNGNEIVFESIPRLAPRADAIFRITVKTTAAGVAHFKARITSTLLVDPVTKEEATRIYAD